MRLFIAINWINPIQFFGLPFHYRKNLENTPRLDIAYSCNFLGYIHQQLGRNYFCNRVF